MKRILPVLAFFSALFLVGCTKHVTPTPPPSIDWTITGTWNYDFTNFVPCSATVTKGCISGFSWGYLQGSTQVVLKTSPASVCTGTTQPQTCTDSANSLLGIGAVSFFIVTNGVDNAGNAVTASATGNTVTVALGAATNAQFTIK